MEEKKVVIKKEIVMACICDYASQVRGKGYLVDSDKEDIGIAGGVGLAPTNLMITAFGNILNTPWGSRGDILMRPDMSTKVSLSLDENRPKEHFVLCDLVELDGSPWSCCPRDWLKRGLAILEDEFGLALKSAFEHEFHYSGSPKRLGNAYGLDAIRLQGEFGNTLINALQTNGIEPESFMPEYGEQQYEITCSPTLGIESADSAIRLREITRSVARHFGHKATFAPIMAMGMVGNGVHLHYSLEDLRENPKSYNRNNPHSISNQMASFTAGVLKYMPEFISLTASSVVSYERLKPNRWSATYNNISNQDREASIRVSPLPTIDGIDPNKRFNLELRAGDATANPYMMLGALVWAGIEGLRAKLELPEFTEQDPSQLSEIEKDEIGIKRLPQTLKDAIDALESSSKIKEWMGEEFHNAYIVHKRSEMTLLDGLDEDEIVRRYVECY